MDLIVRLNGVLVGPATEPPHLDDIEELRQPKSQECLRPEK